MKWEDVKSWVKSLLSCFSAKNDDTYGDIYDAFSDVAPPPQFADNVPPPSQFADRSVRYINYSQPIKNGEPLPDYDRSETPPPDYDTPPSSPSSPKLPFFSRYSYDRTETPSPDYDTPPPSHKCQHTVDFSNLHIPSSSQRGGQFATINYKNEMGKRQPILKKGLKQKKVTFKFDRVL